jgi:hypothetical protein
MRRPLTVVVASLACLACPAAAMAKLPKVLTQHVKHLFVVRPATIEYTGDGTGVLGGTDGSSVRHPGRLDWTKYNRRQGYAKGVDWLNDCRPSCAEGDFHRVPVRVHVFRPRHGRFTRLTLRFTYEGKRVVDRRGIRRYGDYWGYCIINYC